MLSYPHAHTGKSGCIRLFRITITCCKSVSREQSGTCGSRVVKVYLVSNLAPVGVLSPVELAGGLRLLFVFIVVITALYFDAMSDALDGSSDNTVESDCFRPAGM